MGGEDLEVQVPADGLGLQRVDHVVVVQWIVVEQRNALRPGPFGHMAGVASGAVAPVDAGFEQLGGELRVVDQQIDVAAPKRRRGLVFRKCAGDCRRPNKRRRLIYKF